MSNAQTSLSDESLMQRCLAVPRDRAAWDELYRRYERPLHHFLHRHGGARDVEGSLGGHHLAFFPYGAEYAALTGVDLETKPGRLFRNYNLFPYANQVWNFGGDLVFNAVAFNASAQLRNWWTVGTTGSVI